MGSCRWINRVEAYFDGEALANPSAVEEHLASCGVCASYLTQLEKLRGGVEAVRVPAEIGDAQFGAFLEGVRAGMQEPAPAPWLRFRPLMTGLSLAAAALVIATSLFLLFSGPDRAPGAAAATVVERAETDFDGATVDVQVTEEGNATVWLKNAPEHVWWE